MGWESCAHATRPSAPAAGEPLYADCYREIRRSCARLGREPNGSAKAALRSFVLPWVDQSTPNAELLSHLVAEALLQRFDGGLVESSNLYVQHLEHSQTTLYYAMAQAVPLVGASHLVANQFLVDGIAGGESATLFELGTGRGQQLDALLERLADGSPELRRLDVVGIDPVEDNLAATERMIAAERGALPFEVRFRPVQDVIERLSLAQLRELAGTGRGALVINAAFSFHHTRHAPFDDEARTALLRRFARLGPAVMVLCEPSSRHDGEDVLERLEHAWRHFGSLFELVDESVVKVRRRLSVKAHFFGREIRDLFAVHDHYRCERHEPWYAWRARLCAAGFEPRPVAETALPLPASCRADWDAGSLRLAYRGNVVCAVLGYGT